MTGMGPPTKAPRLGEASYSAMGYHGAAKRPGWASLFGGQERAWQDAEWVRKHQAGENFTPGIDFLVLTDKDGNPAAGRSIEINGRKCVASDGKGGTAKGTIKLVDMEYMGKAAAIEEERRHFCQKICSICLNSSALC